MIGRAEMSRDTWLGGRARTGELLEYGHLVRKVIATHVMPYYDEWERAEVADREFWTNAGKFGLIGLGVGEEYGGSGVTDFWYNVVVDEEFARAGALGLASTISLQNDIIAPYLTELATPEQQARWLPGYAAGDLVFAVAMTEAEAGSDLKAVRTTATPGADGTWTLRGEKMFITNGVHADRVIVFARTSTEGRFGLFVVDTTAPGFARGQHLSKIGLRAGDASELLFDDVVVGAADVLGDPSHGLGNVLARLPRERVSIAVTAMAAVEHDLLLTLEHCRNRSVFGKPLAAAQYVRFTLAKLTAEAATVRAYVDQCVDSINDRTLGPEQAAVAKYQASELQGRVADFCLQLHGGSGYMAESPIARAWLDARVQRIYGGANEVLLEVIARNFFDGGAKSR
jgi:alkylation response protein AidB-like acyl-CoA dehydrogenase